MLSAYSASPFGVQKPNRDAFSRVEEQCINAALRDLQISDTVGAVRRANDSVWFRYKHAAFTIELNSVESQRRLICAVDMFSPESTDGLSLTVALLGLIHQMSTTSLVPLAVAVNPASNMTELNLVIASDQLNAKALTEIVQYLCQYHELVSELREQARAAS